jgi:hypothetical protein
VAVPPGPQKAIFYPGTDGLIAHQQNPATAKDPATSNITRGWIRLTGLTPVTLRLACLLAARNQRISPPGTPASTTTPAAPRPACPRKHAADAARPSPAWPPQRHHNPGAPAPRPSPP